MKRFRVSRQRSRRCSVCGQTGHDKRLHDTRRNPMGGFVAGVAGNVIGSHVYEKNKHHLNRWHKRLLGR